MGENACNHIVDMGLLFRIQKYFLQLNKEKITQYFKWEKSLKRYFSKEDTQMVNKQKMLNIINAERNAN